jgi:scavenger receptor class B, member 1
VSDMHSDFKCRFNPLLSVQVRVKHDVQGYRFTPDESVFASVEKNPDNLCYCPAGPPCAPHGFFNVSACQFGETNFGFE